MGSSIKLGCMNDGLTLTAPASVKGDWAIVHANLSATAESATVLMRPSSYSNANVYPARIHAAATRVTLMARYDDAVSTVTTSPRVRVYGVYGPDDAVSEAGVIDETKAIVRRLDSADSNANGITLTLETAASEGCINDGTYLYSNELASSLDGIDLRGAKWLLVLTETAASVSGGANTVVACEAMLLN
jgi:hypothetical protein